MSKKTDVVSIRVDESIKKKLIEESELKNLTLNSLIGQIMTKHVNEGTVYKDLGLTSVRKVLLKKLFKFIPSSDITTISQTTCRDFFKDTTIYLHGKYDLESVIMTLDSWFSTSNIPFKKIESGDNVRMIIRHELGSKWVLYFETMIKAVLNELDIKSDSYVKTVDSLSFRAYR